MRILDKLNYKIRIWIIERLWKINTRWSKRQAWGLTIKWNILPEEEFYGNNF